MVRHKDTKEWEFAIMAAAPRGWRDWNLIVATEPRRDALGLWRIKEHRRRERRRVTITRLVPSRRNFCRDADNRAFTVKPVLDALKRLGLVFDDSRAWIDATVVEDLGADETVIRIERCLA